MNETARPHHALNDLVTALNRRGENLSHSDYNLLNTHSTFLELIRQTWKLQGLWPMEGGLVKERYEEDPIYQASRVIINKHSTQAKEVIIDILADNFGFSWLSLQNKFSSEKNIKFAAEMLFEGVGHALGSYSEQMVGRHFERKMYPGGKSAIDLYLEGRGSEVVEHYRGSGNLT